MQLQALVVPEDGDLGAGIRTDNHYCGGHDGDGGGDHVFAEPLQALRTILYQQAQSRETARRAPVFRRKSVAFRKHSVRKWNNRAAHLYPATVGPTCSPILFAEGSL